VGSDAQDYQDFAFLSDGRTIAVSVSGGSMKPVVLWDTGLGG
jgi:hypothetical protein